MKILIILFFPLWFPLWVIVKCIKVLAVKTWDSFWGKIAGAVSTVLLLVLLGGAFDLLNKF